MAKKIKRIENNEIDVLDLFSAAGVTLENIAPEVSDKKDVKKTLCQYKGFIKVLRDEESVNKYINQCIKNGIVAVDTETNNSLDIHNNIMIGLCLYTPFNRPVYIPIGHRDKATNKLLEGQVSKDFIKTKIEELSKLKLIFHNAKFDINVIRHNFGIHLPLYWDTLIAAKVLDENRNQNGLKFLYVDMVDPFLVDYHVTTFFDQNIYADVGDFGLYSAIDPYDTYKVYELQFKQLQAPSMAKLYKLLTDLEFKVTEVCADMEYRGFSFNEGLCENYIYTEKMKLKELGDRINSMLEPFKDEILSWHLKPEGRGKVVKIDPETKQPVFKKQVNSAGKIVPTDELEYVLDPYRGKELEWPIKLTSPDQVLCLLNCILKIEVTSTVIDDLKSTGFEICRLIGKYRHINHNLTSFFLPYMELSKGNRIHASFNQMGDEDKTVKTGRFSSKNPNLQQLPARQGEDGVRMMFSATDSIEEKKLSNNKVALYFLDEVEALEGWKKVKDLVVGDTFITGGGDCRILSIEEIDPEHRRMVIDREDLRIKIKRPKSLQDNDFSAQEPRVMSSLCGERELIDGYNLRTPEFPKGKDFYAMLASSAFGKDYWECTEFDKEGKFQQEGKNRRQAGKVIQLGVSYGMGVSLLVKGINEKKSKDESPMTMEDGQKMMVDFFGKFKTLKTWKDYNMARLEQFGYMETALGRRRRLYDTWLPDYEVKYWTEEPIEPIFFDIGVSTVDNKGKPITKEGIIRVVDVERSKEAVREIERATGQWSKKGIVEKYKENPYYEIKSNGGFKSRPKTQATNFVIQGGGAELTKRAMVAIYNHPDREKFGINVVAPVHDEILIEGYTEYRKEALELLSKCMANSADGIYEVRMIGDGLIETCWNVGHFKDKIQKQFKKLIEGGKSEEEAYSEIFKTYQEIDSRCLRDMLLDQFDIEVDKLVVSNNCIKE